MAAKVIATETAMMPMKMKATASSFQGNGPHLGESNAMR
jgi:hypothetical protein